MRSVRWGLPLLIAVLAGCGEAGPTPPVNKGPYTLEVSEGFGAAIMILLDTSGSMNNAVQGANQPKHAVARKAVEAMLGATDEFVGAHPDRIVKVGLMHFATRVKKDLEIAPYSKESVRRALERMPSPGGDTAIGDALDAARKELYRSGCMRKYVLVITDGKNTHGVDPERKAREIHDRSGGGVRIYFVAFDTDPAKFAFLKEVGGDVLPARSAIQLDAALKEIYEGKILAEEMPEEVEGPR